MSDETSGVELTARDYASGQKVFGRYTLKKVLGRGGMGVVWLARDEELEREVALKFLPDLVVLDKTLLSELKRETRRSLELTHKNIVRIYDFVQGENSACISMEYIDGDTLSNLRAEKEQRVFQPEEIAPWTAQLCDALEYAHNHARIVHCDLKPANLMVNQRGDLKISDFGIARRLGDSMSKLTMDAGGTSGTLVYMSPQQLDGARGTHLDDIYSLGATFYDLLTSKPPFYSGNIDRQVHERVAPSMTERRKEFNVEPTLVPPVWEETIAACLAKDPGDRPQSAAELAQRLLLTAPRSSTVTSSGTSARLRRPLLIAASIALVALAGTFFAVSQWRAAAPPPSVPAIQSLPEKSIAILPFKNRSEEKANEFFTDGVQDEVLTNLAKIADLKVISRTSVLDFPPDRSRNLREIGQQLGVAYVLEGSVQRDGKRVRINAQLIDARTDAHLWAQTYDRDLADVFAIQSEIAQAIADQLHAKLSPNERTAIEQPPTADMVAFDLYSQARSLLLLPSGFGRVPYGKAVDLLNQAIALDPSFLLAYCQLAYAHGKIYENAEHTPARLALIETAVQAAFRARPDAGEAHLARAEMLYRAYLDYDGALAELEIARRTLPNSPQVAALTAYVLRRRGHREESLRHLQRALELDPRNTNTLQQAVFSLYDLRRYAEVIATLDRVLAINPNDVPSQAVRGLVHLDWKADPRPLHDAIDSIRTQYPSELPEAADFWFICALAERDAGAAELALAALGDSRIGGGVMTFPRSFAEGLLARMTADDGKAHAAFTAARAEQAQAVQAQPDHAPALCVLGVIDAGLGRKEEALQQGKRAMELLPLEKDFSNGLQMIEYFAIIAAWVGEKELACEHLERATRSYSSLIGVRTYGRLKLLPYWDPLRGYPRFEAIVASLAPKQ